MDKDNIPHYMAELVLVHRAVLVVGGGQVARRKLESLLTCKAMVSVVALEIDPQVAIWVEAGLVNYRSGRFEPGLLEGPSRPFLVFAATSDAGLNQAIAHACARQGILCNSADDPSSSGFLVPAVVRRGGVTVAIGTGGLSPALSRVLKERIDAWLEPGWGELVASFGAWRSRVAGLIPDGVARQQFWRDAALAAMNGEWLERKRWDLFLLERLEKLKKM